MTITLERLVQTARQKVRADRARLPERELRDRLRDSGALKRPAGRLRAALEGDGLAVIAEVKGASPIAGRLRRDFDPLALAAAYVDAGAEAISVLTEEQYFAGSLEDLHAVAGAVAVPVLRKDFIVEPYQVRQAALAGAAAILLIADVLAPTELSDLVALARDLRLDALVEAHDAAGLERAAAAGSGLVGVNNRDLRTMAVDWEHSLRVAADLPAEALCVSESGLETPGQLGRLAAAGYDAVLVGSSLVRSTDPGMALRSLRETEAS